MKTLITFMALSLCVMLNAQPPGGKGGDKGERPKIGTYKGVIKSSLDNVGLPFTKIFLLSKRDSSIVTGGLTEEDGSFIIEEIPAGRYIAKITSYGFNTMYIDSLMFHPRNTETDAGDILLIPNEDMLNEIEVTHTTEEFETQIDKKVFNVEKQITAQGGTALDALQNVPSVTIDLDGNVSLRGSANVTILIDGRPSSITGGGRQGALESIPASSIETIEVITNPSAKYDPDGMSGIINIVLKKNKLKGFNGGVDLSIGNGIHPDSLDTYSELSGFNYNVSANLAYRNKFLNVYGSFSTRYNEGYRGFTSSNLTWYDDVYDSLGQVNNGLGVKRSYAAKIGSDFYLNKYNTMGISFNGNIGNNTRSSNIFYYQSNNLNLYNAWQRISEDPGDRNGLDANLFYTKTFEKKYQKLEFNGRYSLGDNSSEGSYYENVYNPDYSDFYITSSNTVNQTVKNLSGNKFLTLQMDYYHPIKNGKIESGVKSTVRQVNQDYYQETFGIPDDSLNNVFDYTEQVHAAYGIFGQDFEKFKYQIGLRVEQVFVLSQIDKDPTDYKNNYFSLYPSVHLVRPLTKTKELTLSYSRRVNRPSLRSLNPFPKYSDPLNLRKGNPELNPEYINSVEIGFGSYGKKLTITSSIYYRYMTDLIQRVKNVDSNGVSTVSWDNLDEGHYIGVELVSIIRPAKWWRIMLSGNFSQTYLNDSSGESDLNNSGLSWSARLMQTFTFTKGWTAQMSGFYMSPIILSQGLSEPMFSIDLALRKSFFDNKMYLNFKVSDIFNTRQFAYETAQEGVFESYGAHKWQSRRATLSFGYRFGNQDPNRKRRNDKGDRGGGEDMGI